MENRDLKKLLMNSLLMEEELIRLVEECLDILFKPTGLVEKAKYHFNEDLEHGFTWNGCLQSIDTMKKNIENEIKKEKQALVEADKKNKK